MNKYDAARDSQCGRDDQGYNTQHLPVYYGSKQV